MRGGMADTLVLGANAIGVWVQVPPHAPKNHLLLQVIFRFIFSVSFWQTLLLRYAFDS